MLTPEQHDAEADRIRVLADEQQPMAVDDRQWLVREVTIQKAALLCKPPTEEGVHRTDSGLMQKYMTDAEFHAWVCFEARIRAEIQLARQLGTQVQNGEVRAFLRARDEILYSEGKQARYATDQEYRQAVFAIAVHRMNEDPERKAAAERMRMSIDYLSVGTEAAAALLDVTTADVSVALRQGSES